MSDSDIEDEARASRARQAADPDPEVGGIAVDRLRSIIERIERLEEERKALANDIKDIYAEAKSAGFDVKVVRTLISLRWRGDVSAQPGSAAAAASTARRPSSGEASATCVSTPSVAGSWTGIGSGRLGDCQVPPM